MTDWLSSIAKYFGSRPTSGIDLVWRIVLATLLCLTLLRLERIRRGQLDTQTQVREVATAVATVTSQLDGTPTP